MGTIYKTTETIYAVLKVTREATPQTTALAAFDDLERAENYVTEAYEDDKKHSGGKPFSNRPADYYIEFIPLF